MTKILFALVVTGGALASMPVLADVNYYGTHDRMTASQEQNNADAGPVWTGGRTGASLAATDNESSVVYGYPTTSAISGTSRRPAAELGDTYLGTSWRYQDNADSSMR